MIKKEILSDTDSIYNYLDGDKVLGYLEIRLVDGVLDIMNLFVNEENRRRGIATSLMNEIIEKERELRTELFFKNRLSNSNKSSSFNSLIFWDLIFS